MNDIQLLIKAAAAMREQNIPGRGYTDNTFLAVANWLALEAEQFSGSAYRAAAVDTARAYLGDTP